MSPKLPCFRGFSGKIEAAPTSDCNTRQGLTPTSDISRKGLPDMVPKTCSIPECEKRVQARGMCDVHYRRNRLYGDPSTHKRPGLIRTRMERFWSKVDKTGDCWIWMSGTRDGYGRFRDGRKMLSAHRVAYEMENGEMKDGLVLDHTCHNPTCVKPAHLRPSTHKQNLENLGGLRSDSTSGFRGVYWDKQKSKWRASVGHNGRKHFAGFFTDIESANAAAIAKRLELFTHNDIDRM